MKSMRAMQPFDSLYNRSKNGKIKEEEVFSLDDIFATSKRSTSSTSIFNDYGFSDDEGDKQESFNISNSMYLDDDKKRKAKNKKQGPASRPSGALEELFASTSTTPAKKPKQNGVKPSSSSRRSKLSKSRSSPAISDLRRTPQPSRSGRTMPIGNSSLTGPRNYFWEVDADEYETDTDDDEDLEFASDTKEASSLRRKTMIKKALFIATRVNESKISKAPLKDSSSKMRRVSSFSGNKISAAPLKRSSSKARKMDALSLSSHRKDRQDDSEKLQSKRLMDSLSISRHSGRIDESPRERRASARKELFDCSDMPTDSKPKRSSSLKSLSSRRLRLEDEESTTKPQKRRSSSRPKPPKKKSFDQSSHSTTGDDEKSQIRKKKRSSSVKRKKQKDLLGRSSHHSQVSIESGLLSPEAPKQRRVPIKRSSSTTEDETYKPESSQSLSSNYPEHERRVPKGSKKSKPDDMMSPRQRRVPIKKSSRETEGEESLPESSKSLSSNSEHGKRTSGSSTKRSNKTKGAITSTPRSLKATRRPSKSPMRSDTMEARSEELSVASSRKKVTRRPSKSPMRSDTMEARSEELSVASRRKLNNMSLSSSEHGRPTRRAAAKGTGGESKLTRKMKRRNSNVA